MNECTRHGRSYVVIRCTHIGERFVVQMSNPGSGYVAVDYVEDLPDDGLLIESTDWYAPTPEQIEHAWDDKVSRLRADTPPDPERSYIHMYT